MHDAYIFGTILTFDKSSGNEVESVTCYDDKVLVGTKSGVLHVVVVERDDEGIVRVQPRPIVRPLAKKPLQKLQAIPELQLLVFLIDGYIAVHDLNTFASVLTLDKTKGTSDFAVRVVKNGSNRPELHICAAIKRRLLFLSLREQRQVVDLCNSDFTFPEVIKNVKWLNDSAIVVATKMEYLLFTDVLHSNKPMSLISTSRQTEPDILIFDNDSLMSGFAVCQDEKLPIYEATKQSSGSSFFRVNRVVTWSEAVLAVGLAQPYLIGLLSERVEVRSLEPHASGDASSFLSSGSGKPAATLIQSYDLHQKPLSVIVSTTLKSKQPYGSLVYVALPNSVRVLSPRPWRVQIDALLRAGDFVMAGRLGELIDEKSADAEAVRMRIKILCAIALHAKHEFVRSLDLFAECNADISGVIKLYPGILPEESRQDVVEGAPYNFDLPLTDRNTALTALANHLVMRRSDVRKSSGSIDMWSIEPTSLNTSLSTIRRITRDRAGVLAEIDTATIKCYLEVGNNGGVGAILRLEDCACDFSVTERLLSDRYLYPEMIQLYRRVEKHDRALEMLERHSRYTDSTALAGPRPTVEYLQKLGKSNLDIIFRKSEWVLKLHPKEGLEIFTGPGPAIANREGGALPVEKVISHLEFMNKDLLIPYLEFLICPQEISSRSPNVTQAVDIKQGLVNQKDSSTDPMHTRLAMLYLDRYRRLKTASETTPRPQHSQLSAHPVSWPRPITADEAYSQLINFLTESSHYDAERLLSTFPEGSEAKAVLYGRLDQHDKALAIHITMLRNLDNAEEHCDRFFLQNSNPAVYQTFVKQLLAFQPANAQVLVLPEDASFREVLCMAKYILTETKSKFELRFSRAAKKMARACLQRAIVILNKHADKLDPVEIVACLPGSTSLASLRNYFQSALRHAGIRLRQSQLKRALHSAQLLLVQREKVEQHRVHFQIDDETVCYICNMPIGNNMLTRTPTGTVAHYLCFTENDQRHRIA